MKRLRADERGQAVTEFALVLPILLVILMGVVEIGRIFHAYLVVEEAARDAARYVSVGVADSQVATAIVNDTTTIGSVSYTITPSDPSQRLSGQPISVNVSCPVNLITPVLDKIFPNPTVVHSTITMRKE